MFLSQSFLFQFVVYFYVFIKASFFYIYKYRSFISCHHGISESNSCLFVCFVKSTGDVCDKENAPITGNKAQSSTQSIPSLDDQLDSFYADQCAKIATSKTNNEITRLASRLESFIAYLYDSKAPSHIIYHGFLEYFVDIVPNQMER